MVFVSLPRHRVHALRFSSCEGVFPPFWPPLLVRSFFSLEALLTHALHCLEPYPATSALLSMSLASLFYSGDKSVSGLSPLPRDY